MFRLISVSSLLVPLLISFSGSPQCRAAAEADSTTSGSGIVGSVPIPMPNGTLPTFSGDQVRQVKELVTKMRTNPAYSIAVIATYSKAQWKRFYGPQAREALQGSIALTRTGVADRLLVKEAGMTKAEIATRYNFAILLDENSKDEPYVEVILAEKTWISSLLQQLEEKLKASIQTLKEELQKSVAQEVQEELKGWIEALVKELLLQQNNGLNGASLVLPMVNGQLSDLNGQDLQFLRNVVTTANSPQNNPRVLILAENRTAARAARDLLKKMGLQKNPLVFYVGVPADKKQTKVAISLATGLGDWAAWDISDDSFEGPDKPTGNAKAPVSLIVGASVGWSSGWDDHRTPGVTRTTVFPTLDAGARFNDDKGRMKAAVVFKTQLPGSIFENEGGRTNLAQIQLLVRAIGPLYFSFAHEQYVSQHIYRKASLPNTDLIFHENPTGWDVGVQLIAPGGVGLGGDVLFVDREYQIPPRWTIRENGDTQVRVYVSYGLSLF